MKKHKLIAVLFILLPCLVNAQFGLKAGLNLSYVTGSNEMVSSKASRVGFEGGLMYKIPVKEDWLSVQPELIYIQKGAEFYIDQLTVDSKLDYVELPVLLVYNPFGGVINFHTGTQFSFLTSVVYTATDDNGQSEVFKDTDLDNYNIFDFGLVLGAGIELEIVMIEFRSSFGFLTVEKGFEFNGQQYDPNTKNFNVQLLAGYFF